MVPPDRLAVTLLYQTSKNIRKFKEDRTGFSRERMMTEKSLGAVLKRQKKPLQAVRAKPSKHVYSLIAMPARFRQEERLNKKGTNQGLQGVVNGHPLTARGL